MKEECYYTRYQIYQEMASYWDFCNNSEKVMSVILFF